MTPNPALPLSAAAAGLLAFAVLVATIGGDALTAGTTVTPSTVIAADPVAATRATLATAARPARAVEWRRVDTTPLATLTPAMKKWAADGGTEMAVDVSFLVDLAEQRAPTGKAYAALAAYVKAAAAAGLRTTFVAGDPHWVAHPYIVDLLDTSLRAYNSAYPRQAVTTLTYDVEPWGLDTWAAAPADTLTAWLDWMSYAVSRHAGFNVGFFTVYWLDGRAWVPSMTYRGTTGTPAQHVGRVLKSRTAGASFVDVMAYQDTTARMSAAMSAWAKLDVPFRMAVEIGPSDPGSTWYGKSWPTIAAAINTVAVSSDTDPDFSGVTVDSVTYLP